MGGKGTWLAAVVMLAVLGLMPGAAAAQQENQAGLVIRFPDGHVETRCIAFAGETIGGDEMLARSGLNIVIDPSSGMGITVCQIEGEGCAYPAEHCFCRCMGGESCGYWNYFYRDSASEAWTYSALGALLRQVPPGGLEAWVWGDGTTPPEADLTFEAVCALPPPTPSATAPEPSATKAPAVTAAEASVAAVTDTPEAPASTVTAVAAAGNTPAPLPAILAPAETMATQREAEGESGSYWAFVLLVALLAAMGLFVLLSQRRGQRR